MGNREFTPDPDKWYGPRYAKSANDDLYQIAGRILSDLRSSQSGTTLPSPLAVAIGVNESTLIVHVFVPSNQSLRTLGRPLIRAMVLRAAERYNWKLKNNQHVTRFKVTCLVHTSRHGREMRGFLFG